MNKKLEDKFLKRINKEIENLYITVYKDGDKYVIGGDLQNEVTKTLLVDCVKWIIEFWGNSVWRELSIIMVELATQHKFVRVQPGTVEFEQGRGTDSKTLRWGPLDCWYVSKYGEWVSIYRGWMPYLQLAGKKFMESV